MSKSSKPKRKYNPRRYSIERGREAIAKAVALADTRRLGLVEQVALFINLENALQEAREVFSPPAFNQLAHGYRILVAIAGKEGMNLPEIERLCIEARKALTVYMDECGAVPMPDQYAAPVVRMLDAMKAVCDDIPLALFESAVACSREALFHGMYEHFSAVEQWGRDAAMQVMDGAKVEDVAKALGRPVPEVAGHVRNVAAIVHAVHGDHLVDFPNSMAKLRKVGPTLKPTLQNLMLTCTVMAQIEEKQAAMALKEAA